MTRPSPPSPRLTRSPDALTLPQSDRIGHPLFPARKEGDDPPEIEWIFVARFDHSTGRLLYVPRRFNADELTDLSQIAELWGGGRYELVGRVANRITARQSWDVAGPSRPLFEQAAGGASQAPLSEAIAPPANLARGGEPQPIWLTLLPTLLPLALEMVKSSAAERQMLAQQSQQMMASVMATQQASSQAFIQAMSGLYQNQHRAPSGGAEDFIKGIDFAENLLAEKMKALEEQGGGTDDMMKTIGEIFGTLRQFGFPGTPGAPSTPGAT
jgi:hypothetical protein